MIFFPIFLNLKDKLCVFFGGGNVAERKILTLMKYDCKIRVVSPDVTEKILMFKEKIEIIRDKYSPKYMEGAFMVFACTSDKKINDFIFFEAKKRNILVNNATSSINTDFVIPSIVDKGRIKIAISTSGVSPALSRLLKENIKKLIGNEYEVLAEIMEKIREKQLTQGETSDKNREKFYKFLNEDVLELIKNRNFAKVQDKIKKIFGFNIKIK